MSNEGKIEIIPGDCVITIQCGGGLYARINQIMYSRASQKTPEEFAQLLEHLKNGGKARDPYEYEIETYLSLLYELERAASEQKVTKFISPDEIKVS